MSEDGELGCNCRCVAGLWKSYPNWRFGGTHLVAQPVKNPLAMQETTCSAGDPGSMPGSGRSPGEGNGNPLQYYCLENPMDRGALVGCIQSAGLQKTGT